MKLLYRDKFFFGKNQSSHRHPGKGACIFFLFSSSSCLLQLIDRYHKQACHLFFQRHACNGFSDLLVSQIGRTKNRRLRFFLFLSFFSEHLRTKRFIRFLPVLCRILRFLLPVACNQKSAASSNQKKKCRYEAPGKESRTSPPFFPSQSCHFRIIYTSGRRIFFLPVHHPSPIFTRWYHRFPSRFRQLSVTRFSFPFSPSSLVSCSLSSRIS